MRRLMPGSAGFQRAFKFGNERIIRKHSGFEMQFLNFKNALFAMSFRVKTANQLIVVQNRQAVVTVLALGRREIKLDGVIEAKQVKRPITIPNQRIERRE